MRWHDVRNELPYWAKTYLISDGYADSYDLANFIPCVPCKFDDYSYDDLVVLNIKCPCESANDGCREKYTWYHVNEDDYGIPFDSNSIKYWSELPEVPISEEVFEGGETNGV